MRGIKHTTLIAALNRKTPDCPPVDAYSAKDIFNLLWPEGLESKKTYVPLDNEDLSDCKNLPLKLNIKHLLFVKCRMPECKEEDKLCQCCEAREKVCRE